MKKPLAVEGAVLFMAFLWSWSGYMNHQLGAVVGRAGTIGGRNIVAFLGITLLCRVIGVRLSFASRDVWIGAALLALTNGFFVAATSGDKIGAAMVLVQLSPVFSYLLEPIITVNRPPRGVLLPSVGAVIGSAMILGDVHGGELLSGIYGILSAVTYAALATFMRRSTDRSGSRDESYSMLVAGYLLIALFFTPSYLESIGRDDALLLAVVAGSITCIAVAIGVWATPKISPTVMLSIATLEGPLALVWAWWLLDEEVTVLRVVGAAITILCVWWASLAGRGSGGGNKPPPNSDAGKCFRFAKGLEMRVPIY